MYKNTESNTPVKHTAPHNFYNDHLPGPWIERPPLCGPSPSHMRLMSEHTYPPQQNKAYTDTVWCPSPVAFISPSFKSHWVLMFTIGSMCRLISDQTKWSNGKWWGLLNKSKPSPFSIPVGANLSRENDFRKGSSTQAQMLFCSPLHFPSRSFFHTHADTLLSLWWMSTSQMWGYEVGGFPFPRGLCVALAGEKTSVT